MNFTLPTALRSSRAAQHAVGGGFVGGEDAVGFEGVVGILETGEEVFRVFVGGVAGGAAVLVRADDFDVGEGFEGVEKTLFAFFGAGLAFVVTEDDHAALVIQQLGHGLAGELAALVVVGGDEGFVGVGLDVGIDDDHGNILFGGGIDDVGEGIGIVGSQHDGGDTAIHHIFDDIDLLGAVVFQHGAMPDDVEFQRRRPGLPAGLWPRRAWMDFQNSSVVPLGITAIFMGRAGAFWPKLMVSRARRMQQVRREIQRISFPFAERFN